MHGRHQKPGGEGKPRYFIDSSYCQVCASSQFFVTFERLRNSTKSTFLWLTFGLCICLSRTMTRVSGSGRGAITATRLAQSSGLEQVSMITFGTRRRPTPRGRSENLVSQRHQCISQIVNIEALTDRSPPSPLDPQPHSLRPRRSIRLGTEARHLVVNRELVCNHKHSVRKDQSSAGVSCVFCLSTYAGRRPCTQRSEGSP